MNAIKGVISGICLAIGFVFGKVILKSLVDAMRVWGVLGTLLFVIFAWAVTLTMYMRYDLMHAVCSVIVILCIHLAFWSMGHFSHN